MERSSLEAGAHEAGVYYRREDHPGFWRRLAIDLIDIVAAGVLWLALTAAVLVTLPGAPWVGSEPPAWPFTATLVGVGLGYFVLLKRSRFRTLGYRLLRSRIVNLQGCQPSLFAMTLRLLFVAFGPLNFLLDLAWVTGDPFRQALRDKFAQTYVIRDRAEPEGGEPLGYSIFFVFGMTFMFRGVQRFNLSGSL